MGIESAKKAIANAGITVDDIDGIILGTSHSLETIQLLRLRSKKLLVLMDMHMIC